MRKFTLLKHTLRTIIISMMVIYFGLIALLNIPFVQQGISSFAVRELSKLLNTEVKIGNIDLGLLNRIIVNDMEIYGPEGERLVNIARFSAKFDIQAIIRGKISINSIQLFGSDFNLEKKDKNSDINIKFITDLFINKDKDKEKKAIDLRINSVLVRRSSVNFNILSEAETEGKFNPSHLSVKNISANISLKALTEDSLNIHVKRLSMAEKSGLILKKLSFKAIGNKSNMRIDDFELLLPNSNIRLDSLVSDFNNMLNIRKISDINYRCDMSAKIVLSDIKPLVPSLKNFNDTINLYAGLKNEGSKHYIKNLNIYSNDRTVTLAFGGNLTTVNDSTDMYFDVDVKKLDINEKGVKWIFKNINGNANIPDIVHRISSASISGNIKGTPEKIENKLIVYTPLGNIKSNFFMNRDSINKRRSYSGRFYSEKLNLGKLAKKKNMLGNASFDITLNGLTYQDNKPESYVKGEIKSLDVKGYTYHNIKLNGMYTPGGFNGHIAINDKNVKLNIDGKFSTAEEIPVFKLTAGLKDFRPDRLKLTEKYVNTTYSLNLLADFRGKSIDDIEGYINIDSLTCTSENADENYFLPYFRLIANKNLKGNDIQIKSNFINGEINGNYSYKTITSSVVKVAHRYIPSFFQENNRIIKQETSNNFTLKFKIDNSDFLKKVLKLPIEMNMPATLNGYIDDSNTKVYINANIPEIIYNNKKYESTTLLFENPEKDLHCHIRSNMLMNKGAMVNVSLNAKAYNDTLATNVYWGNNTNVTYSGKISANTIFSKNINNSKLHTEIELEPSQVVLNDTIWNIHKSNISIDNDSIDISNFLFEHGKQYVKINGRLGKKESDSCMVNLQNVNLLYIMDMIQFNAVKFEGNASGKIFASNVLNKPLLDARLKVNNFSLNEALLGEADIKGGFDNEKGRILLDADIRKSDGVFTGVKGYVSPKEKGLDLSINAGGTDMSFLQHFIKDIFTDIKGKAYGNVRLFGPFKGLDLEGRAKAEIGMKVNVLNSYFNAKADSVIINSGEFIFNNVQLSDNEGHTGTANGYLRHRKLKNLSYMFRFDTSNMMVFSSDKESPEFPFYGKIYASGRTTIRGNESTGLVVDGNVRAENNTSFVYVLGTATEAISKQFITFVDKTPRRRQEEIKTDLYHYLNVQKALEEEDTPPDIRINLQIEPSPQADMKIIMDPASGDYISAKGTGSLRISFFNKGNFQIFGNYNISEGIYKLSMQNIIRKDFVLRQGGSVSFNGDPKAANLNVQAVYTVPSASLNDLIADATSTRGNIRVNCIVNLSGLLTSPNLSFDIELPTVNEEDRQVVKSLTSTPEQMTTQIIYLLGVGKFYTYDYAAQSGQSDATSSLAFSTLSGQLNNMLSQVIDNQNWNLGTNLTTGQNGWTDVEAEAILSGRLLNNRLIINGNFGYKENTLRNTNFVGDFEAIWLLTKNGDFRLRGYNQTNDRYFTKSTLTTQGIGLIYKKDFTRWDELIDWVSNFRLYRKKKLSQNKK
ncbi:translocation/assembly module TamB domain-containing protein [uncultured Bacteroides sp.]|uniref:translocation/assembly module TamB domain-containing protein n=1 Tax=uncultured Bacteroides sp. TaxID=162156 RepID=UPI0026081F5D|nr:translocation/assembly module TamB domain-containing protein [uncultured Bacteroides sp.]